MGKVVAEEANVTSGEIEQQMLVYFGKIQLGGWWKDLAKKVFFPSGQSQFTGFISQDLSHGSNIS